jgi:vancomycin resistance protein YoaR
LLQYNRNNSGTGGNILRRSVQSKNQPAGNSQVRHASFQADALDGYVPVLLQASLMPEEADDWYAGVQDYSQDGSWQAPFIPQEQDWALREEPAPVYHGQPPESARRNRSGWWSVLAFASLLAIGISIYSAYQAYQANPGFQTKLRAMARKAFFNGIEIDGQSVGGMTMEQVLAQSLQREANINPLLNLRLQVDELVYRITGSEIPFQRNTAQVIEEAWSIGRQGFAWGLNSGITPFEIRWKHAQQTAREKAYFSTQFSYDFADVQALAQSIAAQINNEPINAVIQEFNFTSKEFKVTRDVPGRFLQASDIATVVKQALDNGRYDAQLAMQSASVLPKVSSVALQNSFTKLSSFSTKTDSNEDRNNNIALAAQYISNKTVMPGEVFSFNAATGQRTIQKGFRGAPAIQGGVLIDDVGGGVCQVSSTLFNAAAIAGMHIVERDPHAWPVSYLDSGLDATVNWPNLDFKFRNDNETPVFIIAYYKNRAIHVEFYGMLSAPGESVRLEATLISATDPPNEPIMQPNPILPFGTSKELKKARTGYVVETYRVFLRNGQEYRREKLFTSNYKMVQQVIEYN